MNSKFIDEFKSEMLGHLELAGIDVSQIDETKFHNYCIANLKTDELVIYNNVKQTESEVNSLKLVDMIMYSKTKPIITGYNTLFHNHDKAENIPGGFLDYLKATRSEAKKKMHAHVNDVVKTLFNSYDTKQLIMKLLANSYYGAFGQSGLKYKLRINFFNCWKLLMGQSAAV